MKETKIYTDDIAADILHQTANLYISTNKSKDYGTGDEYSSVEVHLLRCIAQNEGITVTEIAKKHIKTKGAISQTLKKLEQKDLIHRKPDPDNDKRVLLYITEKGKILDDAHRYYDSVHFGESMDVLRTIHTVQDIQTTFRVLESWLEVRREVQVKRDRKKRLLAKQKRLQNKTED